MVVNTELLIRRNSFAYAFRGDREVSMSDPVYFAQTLQVTQVDDHGFASNFNLHAHDLVYILGPHFFYSVCKRT